MNLPSLDDDLRRLADQLTAPPTSEARQAIVRRAGVLRRRRRVRNAVGGGLLALAVVAGAVAVTAGQSHDVEMDPGGPARTGAAPLPALTLDLAGWAIVSANDLSVSSDVAPAEEDPAYQGSLQVFRHPGDLTGPSVALFHGPASDAVQAEPGDRTVAVGGAEGYLRQTGERSFTLRWTVVSGDSHATLQAWGLGEDQVLDFAAGLRVKDDDIMNPPGPDDEFGFVATRHPEDVEEVPMSPVNPKRPGLRLLDLEAGARTAHVVIDEGGEEAFEAKLADLLETAGEVDAMTVLKRPAVAVEHPDDGSWSLIWRQTDEALVVATLTGVDRATVADVAGGVREIPDDEWYDLVSDDR